MFGQKGPSVHQPDSLLIMGLIQPAKSKKGAEDQVDWKGSAINYLALPKKKGGGSSKRLDRLRLWDFPARPKCTGLAGTAAAAANSGGREIEQQFHTDQQSAENNRVKKNPAPFS